MIVSDVDPKVFDHTKKKTGESNTHLGQRMSTKHPPTFLPHSLASSESTLDPNDQTDMDSTEKGATFGTTGISEETTRNDIPSEADDAGHDHDEASDSHVHSEEEENDGTWRTPIVLTKQTFSRDYPLIQLYVA